MTSTAATPFSPIRTVFIDFVGGRAVISREIIALTQTESSAVLIDNPLLLSAGRTAPRAIRSRMSFFNPAAFAGSHIVIGLRSDPFSQIDANLFAAIELVDRLAACKHNKVIVRTRSPYVVLAVPGLQQLCSGNSAGGFSNCPAAAVCFAFEAASAAHSRAITKNQSLPSERIETAKALQSYGIPLIIQLAPFFGSGAEIGQLRSFCSGLQSLSAQTTFIEFDRLIEPSAKAARSELAAAETAAYDFKHRIAGETGLRQSRSLRIARQIFAELSGIKSEGECGDPVTAADSLAA